MVAVEGPGRLPVVKKVEPAQPGGVGFEGGSAKMAQFALGAEHVDKGEGFCHGREHTRRIVFREKNEDLLARVGVIYEL